jgi:hypothetical protein
MNKLRERAIVNGFIRWGGQPGLSLLEWDRERPDALIADGDQIVGIEVTAINEAVSRQAIAPQKWTTEAFRIVDEARRIYETRSTTTVIVRFEMRHNWVPPIRQKFLNLAADLALLVEQTLTEPPAWLLDKEPYTLRDPHTDVSWAYISRSDYGNHWQPSISGEVLSVSEADVRSTIARKEVEVAAYRQVAPKVWLLIDCDVSGQGIALDVPMQHFAIESAFDRVFCCGFGMWQWVEILTVKSDVGTPG